MVSWKNAQLFSSVFLALMNEASVGELKLDSQELDLFIGSQNEEPGASKKGAGSPALLMIKHLKSLSKRFNFLKLTELLENF